MSFFVETKIAKCRKNHRCFWCGEFCLTGQPAVRIVGSTGGGGDFGWSYFHPECDAAYKTMTSTEREGHGLDDPDDGCDPGMFKRGTTELK